MNLSPKSRCKVRRQVNNRVSTKLVTPNCSSLASQITAAKNRGPLAKGFLSQGRSSETRPLGDESVARRLGDLRSLLAIRSRRSPNLQLFSQDNFAKRKVQEKCENHLDDKNLESLPCNAAGQLLQQSDGSLTSSGSGSDGWKLEIVSGMTSSLDNEMSNHPGPKLPSIAAAGKCCAYSGRPMQWSSGAFGNLLAEKGESRQLVFADAESRSSQGQESCECPTFGNGHFYCHRSVHLFKSRSQQNVFGDFCDSDKIVI